MSKAEEKLFDIKILRVLRTLWPSLRCYRFQFALGSLLILCATTIEVINPILVGKVVDAVSEGTPDRARVYRLAISFLVLILLKSVAEFFQAFVIQRTGQRVTHELRSLVFARIQRLPVSYFDRNPTGRLLTRVMNDIKSLSELFTASVSVLALDLMVIVGTVLAMFWLNARLAALVLLGFPIVLFSIHFFGRRLAEAYRAVRGRLSSINAFLGENIGAIATIQRLGAEQARLNTFSLIVDGHTEAQLDSVKVFSLVQPLANVLNGLAIGTLLIVGGLGVAEGTLTIGLVVAFLGYLRNLFQPIRNLVEKYNTFLSAMVSAERVVNLIEEPSEGEIEAHPVSRRDLLTTGIEFRSVYFRYGTRSTNALSDISFTVPQGRSLAVVGATGSGKSTLIRLLLRFYEATSGNILFGGKSLKDWDRYELRALIGVVHQEIYLFEGTLRDNLTLGKEGFTDGCLIERAVRAELWDFVERRGGLDMPIYEGGSNLSLGERQLLSFARVLVFDLPVLILDEATSSIDRLIERKMLKGVNEVMRGRTSILIAHRLTTIQHCDEVLVLDQGLIAEKGTYRDLLERDGLFKKLHDLHHSVRLSAATSP